MNKDEAGGFFVRSLNRRKSFGRCLFRLNSPPMRFPPQAVMGGSSPCTPEPGDFSRGCRPAFAENDPLDHFPGASALLDLIKRQTCRRCASGPAAESRQPGCFASGESRSRIRFSLAHVLSVVYKNEKAVFRYMIPQQFIKSKQENKGTLGPPRPQTPRQRGSPSGHQQAKRLE